MITLYKTFYDQTPHYIPVDKALKRIQSGRSEQMVKWVGFLNIFYYICLYKNAVAGRILRHFNPFLGDSGRNLLEPGKGFLSFMQLTQELVRELFEYHEDGYLTYKIKTNYKHIIGELAGDFSKSLGRYRVCVSGKRYLRSRVIFLWHYGWLPDIVDHENRIKIDDKINNLRAASRSENNKNTTSAKNSTSKYLGVSLFKRDMNWHSQICINGKQTHIGYFNTPELAAMAYNKWAVKYHAEFANLNIITP